MSIVPGLNSMQGGGFPFLTGFGQTTFPGGFSNVSTGTPGILGFGFPTPFVDPSLFSIPTSSSFYTNILLGAAAGLAVPINFGPIPSTLGFPPLLLGVPILGGTTNTAQQGFTGMNPFQSMNTGFMGMNPFQTMNTGSFGMMSDPFSALSGINAFGGLSGGNIFGMSGTGIPGGTPGFSTLGRFNGFG